MAGCTNGKIKKSDVTVAKNYLTEKELGQLNRMVSAYLDFAEKQGASLTVMKGGGHWFHTEEEMKFLDEWIKNQK